MDIDPDMPADAGNPYRNDALIEAAIGNGAHRAVIGGLWEEIGSLQFETMLALGLARSHRLLDIGCGCLRLGVKAVPYLEPGNYFGVDLRQELLDAGYDIEIAALGLCGRLPRGNLVRDGNFDFDVFGIPFDFMLAQSLFTHLPANEIRKCLASAARTLATNGKFAFTYFETPGDAETPVCQTGGVVTYPDRDPFHYSLREIGMYCNDAGLDLKSIGDWRHPRGQKLCVASRLDSRRTPIASEN